MKRLFLFGLASVVAATALANPNVVAWGNNVVGQTNVPPELTNAVAVAAGMGHSLALRADGTVVAWGDNSLGQTEVPAGLSNVLAVAGGLLHSLALRMDGTVAAWGGKSEQRHLIPPYHVDSMGETDVPAGLNNVVAIAAGQHHNLALRADGTVVAWGMYFGEEYWFPMDVPAGLSNVMAVACGANHSLALRVDGTVAAWGAYLSGQIAVPTGLSNVIAIAGTGSQSLALRADGTIVAWGGRTEVPVGLSNVVTIVSGGEHNLALIGAGPPVVTPLQADRRVAQESGKVIFYAPAVGGWPLTYQWQFNGTDLPGATNAWLLLPNGVATQSGYSVTVSNASGTVTAPVARLTVVPAVFTWPPTNQLYHFGGTVRFQPELQTVQPLTYQWRFNGVDLEGETNAALVLSNLTWSHEGAYSAVVSNRFGTVLSPEARLSLVNVAGWGSNKDGTVQFDAGQARPPRELTNIVAVAAGDVHSVALRPDGTVVAWGQNRYGQRDVPPGLSNVVAVSCGGWHSLALRADRTVIAWGRNDRGQTNVPPGLSNVVAVAAGDDHNLALLTDGVVVGWGDNSSGQTNVSAGLSNVVAIAGGGDQSLALRTDGTVVAWGYNGFGQTNVPAGLSNVAAIAGGYRHSLALRADGTVVAWGSNSTGQTNVPVGLSNLVAIAAGGYHSLALRADGTVVAWGHNDFGQTNVPADLSNVFAIAGGGRHSLAIIAGRSPVLITTLPDQTVFAEVGTVAFQVHAVGPQPLSYQWLFNGTNLPGATNASLVLTDVLAGQAGLYSVTVSNAWGTVTTRSAQLTVVPVLITQQPQDEVAFLGGITTLEVRAEGSELSYQWQFNGIDLPGETNSTLILRSITWAQDGVYSVRVSNRFGSVLSRQARLAVNNLAAWGSHWYGSPLASLNVSASLSNVVAVAGGSAHTLALRSDGRVVAWGDNSYGQTTVPANLSNAVAIAANAFHCLALGADGTVVAWGDNFFGQRHVPQGLSAVAIACGGQHNLALRADGTVIAWGHDSFGQTDFPAGLSNLVAIAGGGYHSLALRADGTVVAWGQKTNVPAGLSDPLAIAAGEYHSLALRADGTVAAWGINDFGQTTVPSELSNVVAIASGRFHSLALRADGKMIAWGAGTLGTSEWPHYGQSIVPVELANVVAGAAGSFHSLAVVGEGPPVLQVQLVNPSLNNGIFSVSLPTRSGRVYALEFKNSLGDIAWTALPLVAGNSGLVTLTDPSAPGAQRFYRMRQW